MTIIYKLWHKLKANECLNYGQWFYDVLFCTKCKSVMAYHTYEEESRTTGTCGMDVVKLKTTGINWVHPMLKQRNATQ